MSRLLLSSLPSRPDVAEVPLLEVLPFIPGRSYCSVIAWSTIEVRCVKGSGPGLRSSRSDVLNDGSELQGTAWVVVQDVRG